MTSFSLPGALRRIRRSADLSQRELAGLLNVSKSSVAGAEAGDRSLDVGLLAAAAELAGLYWRSSTRPARRLPGWLTMQSVMRAAGGSPPTSTLGTAMRTGGTPRTGTAGPGPGTPSTAAVTFGMRSGGTAARPTTTWCRSPGMHGRPRGRAHCGDHAPGP